MNNKMKLAAILISIMFLLTVTFAASEYVVTKAWWTVPTNIEFIVFLPGAAGDISDPSNTYTTDINFSSFTGSDKYTNATVVGGASQTDSTPIYTIYNTGTVNINLTLKLNQTQPTGVVLWGGTNFTSMSEDLTYSVNDTEHWIVNDTLYTYLSADWNQTVWLWSNFTSVTGGMYARNITIEGNDY